MKRTISFRVFVLPAVALATAGIVGWLLRPQPTSSPPSTIKSVLTVDPSHSEALPIDGSAQPRIESILRARDGNASIDGDDPAEPPALGRVEGTIWLRGSTRWASQGIVEIEYALPGSENEAAGDLEVSKEGRFGVMLPAGAELRSVFVDPRDPRHQRTAPYRELHQELDGLIVREGETLALDLVVDEGFFVTGRVIDRETHLPVEDAWVSAVWWDMSFSEYACATNGAGEFRIGGMDPDIVQFLLELEILAQHPRFLERRIRIAKNPEQASIEGILVELDAGEHVHGFVHFDDGRPAADAVVIALRRGSEESLGTSLKLLTATLCSDNGGFQLPAFEGLEPVTLLALHKKAARLEIESIVPDSQGTPLDLCLPPSTLAKIEPVGPDGQALMLLDSWIWTESTANGETRRSGLDESCRTALQEHSLALPINDPIQLKSVATFLDSGRRLLTATRSLVVPPDSPRRIEVKLQYEECFPATSKRSMFPSDGRCAFVFQKLADRIVIAVRGSDGSPLGKASIVVESPGQWLTSVPQKAGTDPDGRFELDLPPGRHFLRFVAPGHVPRCYEIRAEFNRDREATLVLEKS